MLVYYSHVPTPFWREDKKLFRYALYSEKKDSTENPMNKIAFDFGLAILLFILQHRFYLSILEFEAIFMLLR